MIIIELLMNSTAAIYKFKPWLSLHSDRNDALEAIEQIKTNHLLIEYILTTGFIVYCVTFIIVSFILISILLFASCYSSLCETDNAEYNFSVDNNYLQAL